MKLRAFPAHGTSRPPFPIQAKKRVVSTRPLPCTVCGKTILVRSLTSPLPEAPEFLQLPETGMWIGIVAGDVCPEVILGCSEICVQTLFAHGSENANG